MGNRPTVRRLKYLVNIRKPYMLAVLEPLIDVSLSDDIMRVMGFDIFCANNGGVAKIWVFGRASNQMEVVRVFEQALTISMFGSDIGSMVFITIIYASCDGMQHRGRWEHLFSLAEMNFQRSWFVVGDFNSFQGRSI